MKTAAQDEIDINGEEIFIGDSPVRAVVSSVESDRGFADSGGSKITTAFFISKSAKGLNQNTPVRVGGQKFEITNIETKAKTGTTILTLQAA